MIAAKPSGVVQGLKFTPMRRGRGVLSPMCKAFLDMTRFFMLFTLDDLFW